MTERIEPPLSATGYYFSGTEDTRTDLDPEKYIDGSIDSHKIAFQASLVDSLEHPNAKHDLEPIIEGDLSISGQSVVGQLLSEGSHKPGNPMKTMHCSYCGDVFMELSEEWVEREGEVYCTVDCLNEAIHR